MLSELLESYDTDIHPVAPGCVIGILDRYWVVDRDRLKPDIARRAAHTVRSLSRQLVTCKSEAVSSARVRLLVTAGSADKIPAIREAFDRKGSAPIRPNSIVTDLRTARALIG